LKCRWGLVGCRWGFDRCSVGGGGFSRYIGGGMKHVVLTAPQLPPVHNQKYIIRSTQSTSVYLHVAEGSGHEVHVPGKHSALRHRPHCRRCLRCHYICPRGERVVCPHCPHPRDLYLYTQRAAPLLGHVGEEQKHPGHQIHALRRSEAPRQSNRGYAKGAEHMHLWSALVIGQRGFAASCLFLPIFCFKSQERC
jgi:hypothetical protein